jgi:hypothetical protein
MEANMEPFLISLGGALAAGAGAAAKDTAVQAVKDAYAGVRQYIRDRYAAVSLEGLDKEPQSKEQSKEQQRVVEEQFAKAGVQPDLTLAKLLSELVDAIKTHAPDAATTVGVDLRDIRAAVDVQIERVGAGGPVKINQVEAKKGSVIIKDVGGQSKN